MSDPEYHGAVELRFYGTGAQVRQQIAALFGSTSLSSPGAAVDNALFEAGVKAALAQQASFAESTPITENVAATADPTPPPATGEESPKRGRGRPKKELAGSKEPEPEPAIRATPEDRQDPADVQAQDAADEAAEAGEGDPTVDDQPGFPDEPEETAPAVSAVDVRNALGRWMKRAGGPQDATNPVMTAYKKVFADVTGGAFQTVKDLTEKNAPQDVLRALLAAIDKQAA